MQLLQCVRGIQLTSISADVTPAESRVSFAIEDPVAQMELEHQLKETGSFLDFHRNREVVTLRLIDFLRHAARDSDAAERKLIESIVTARIEDKEQADKIARTLEAKTYLRKSEGEKLVAFIELLGETFAAKPTKLLKHMREIMRASHYRATD